MRRITADMGLLLVGLLWGGGFIATKIGLNEGITPLYMVALRFVIAAIVMCIAFRKVIPQINKKELKKFTILSTFLFFAFIFQTIGSKYTSASKSAFYTGVNVIFVPYVAWMLNRKAPDIYTYISTLLCLLGIGIISYVPGTNLFQLNMGDALVILSAVFYGAHVAYIGHLTKSYRVDKIMVVQNTEVAILSTVILIVLSLIPGTGESIRLLNKYEFWSIIYLGLISTSLCLFMQGTFQRYTSSVRAAIYLSTESLFAPIFAFLILNEELSMNVYIGGFFIILAILLSETKLGLNLIFDKKRRIK